MLSGIDSAVRANQCIREVKPAGIKGGVNTASTNSGGERSRIATEVEVPEFERAAALRLPNPLDLPATEDRFVHAVPVFPPTTILSERQFPDPA